MISVIVPVYNVEPYLRKCLDSIINQTYRDLEILIIDDGSTDDSGKICDEYEEQDSRIKAFHTENRGLSAARNLGLDEANGDWIGFVDSDDWIEPDMYEVLLKRAEETAADIVECGLFIENLVRTEENKRTNQVMSGKEAVSMLLHNELYNAVWNKLWKHRCFESIRFPVNRIYEDIATTYRLFNTDILVCTIEASKYHYCYRETSLTKTRNMKNITGYWLSHRERYEYLKNQVDEETEKILMRFCAEAAARTWSNYCGCSAKDRSDVGNVLKEINDFTRANLPLFGYREWDIRLRIGTFFPHFINTISLRTAWAMDSMYKKIVANKVFMEFLEE